MESKLKKFPYHADAFLLWQRVGKPLGRFVWRMQVPRLEKQAGNCAAATEISGRHRIQGIGAGFVPALLDRALSRQVQQPTTKMRCLWRVDCRH